VLGQLFNQVPGVESVAIVTDRDTGQSRGFGFVERAMSEAADEAVRKAVCTAEQRGGRRPGGGSAPECHLWSTVFRPT
jgi:RNA recognition motif-containing protein